MNIIKLIIEEIENKYPALYRDAKQLKEDGIMDVDNTAEQNKVIDERDDYTEDLLEDDDEGYEMVVDK